MLIAWSVVLVNKNDQLAKNAIYVPEIDGYETIICHADADRMFVYTNDQLEIAYSAREFAEVLRNSPSYHGGNIRLFACNAGSTDNGLAQQLADILLVDVLAPTETIWTNEKGDFFITKHEALARLWYDGVHVVETGRWKLFSPRKEEK